MVSIRMLSNGTPVTRFRTAFAAAMELIEVGVAAATGNARKAKALVTTKRKNNSRQGFMVILDVDGVFKILRVGGDWIKKLMLKIRIF